MTEVKARESVDARKRVRLVRSAKVGRTQAEAARTDFQAGEAGSVRGEVVPDGSDKFEHSHTAPLPNEPPISTLRQPQAVCRPMKTLAQSRRNGQETLRAKATTTHAERTSLFRLMMTLYVEIQLSQDDKLIE